MFFFHSFPVGGLWRWGPAAQLNIPQDPDQFAPQRGLNNFRPALPARHTAHIGGIDMKLASHPPVNTPDQRGQVHGWVRERDMVPRTRLSLCLPL